MSLQRGYLLTELNLLPWVRIGIKVFDLTTGAINQEFASFRFIPGAVIPIGKFPSILLCGLCRNPNKSRLILGTTSSTWVASRYKYSIIGDSDFVIQRSITDCQIDELVYLSLNAPTNYISIDKPVDCKRREDNEGSWFGLNFELGEPRVFLVENIKIIIARDGFPLKIWNLFNTQVERVIQWSDGLNASFVSLSYASQLLLAKRGNKLTLHSSISTID